MDHVMNPADEQQKQMAMDYLWTRLTMREWFDLTLILCYVYYGS